MQLFCMWCWCFRIMGVLVLTLAGVTFLLEIILTIFGRGHHILVSAVMILFVLAGWFSFRYAKGISLFLWHNYQ
ncbi:MAG: hypothetical protein A3J55_03045 [Candidatus Ryanbacteria bacterium RIFCSPHIGHO2_02_FULL_45_17b]|nr:MAG: hypothetical protein A3J55_03045 [Candidatus Ryanbacteria bacterium RIFCSPHIGHO2_02_FULL_45_17b]